MSFNQDICFMILQFLDFHSCISFLSICKKHYILRKKCLFQNILKRKRLIFKLNVILKKKKAKIDKNFCYDPTNLDIILDAADYPLYFNGTLIIDVMKAYNEYPDYYKDYVTIKQRINLDTSQSWGDKIYISRSLGDLISKIIFKNPVKKVWLFHPEKNLIAENQDGLNEIDLMYPIPLVFWNTIEISSDPPCDIEVETYYILGHKFRRSFITSYFKNAKFSFAQKLIKKRSNDVSIEIL